MSARMVRRALEEQEAQRIGESTSDQDEVEHSPTGKPAHNLFDLLRAEEVGDEDDEDEIEVEPQISKQDAPVSKSKKKSKAKRKGKSTSEVIEEESVDELLERLALQNEENASTSESATAADVDPFEILGVDPRYLRAEDELRRIFGSKVINAAERSGDGARKRQIPHRGGRVSLKKTLLVTPHEHWPRPDGGLSMECTDTKDGLNYFRYVYSSSYQGVQKRYEECSNSHDPNTIVMVVNQHPYHVDSLLILAELYRHMGESQRSADLLERALYALEYAWHPWFNITTGRSRLDFGWQPNRALFVALFKHMQHLDRRGCHRTALEVCKLLLSLDSDDPMGSVFCIDYFAIRAEQYQWLQAFASEYGSERSLPLLPSFSFSLALAQFHILGSEHELLQQALMLHPGFLKKIVEKAPIKEDDAWAKLLKHHHFSRVPTQSPTLEHLFNIYVARSYLIWRPPEVQAWLKEGAQAVIAVADNGGADIANWACVRREAFSADVNEYRHLLVSDFSDATATLPPEEIQQFFPAGDNGNAVQQDAMAQAAEQGRQLEDQNALMVFFRSFLPWYNHGVDLQGQDPRREA